MPPKLLVQSLTKNRLGQLFKHLSSPSQAATPVVGYLIGLNGKQSDQVLIMNFMKSLSNLDESELELMNQIMIPNGLSMIGIYTTMGTLSKFKNGSEVNASNLAEVVTEWIGQFSLVKHSDQFHNIIVMVGSSSEIIYVGYDLTEKKAILIDQAEDFSEINVVGDQKALNAASGATCIVAKVKCSLDIAFTKSDMKEQSIIDSFKTQIDRYINTLQNEERVILRTIVSQPVIDSKKKQPVSTSTPVEIDYKLVEQSIKAILPEQLNTLDSFTQQIKADLNYNKKESKNKKKKLPKQTLGEFLKTTEQSNNLESKIQSMNTISKILHLECFVNMVPNQYNEKDGFQISIGSNAFNLVCKINLESASYIQLQSGTTVKDLQNGVIKGLLNQLTFLKNNIGKNFLALSIGTKNIQSIGFYQFLPKEYPHIFTCCYPFYSDDIVFEQRNEQYAVKLREEYHKRLYFSLKQPFIRTNQCISFSQSGKTKVSEYNKKLLNPHLYVGYPSTIKSSNSNTLHLVRGDYQYSHYCQDKFNDEGWGCAYRSLQTLISHAQYHQGAGIVNLPTHEEIQKCLVDCGDKKRSFLGSSQWIGAFENTIVMEKWCGIQCKVLYVSRGDEMNSQARAIANHFDQNGSPIMIGGGVLAYTMLGIDFDEMTGEVSYLILDPHFTGSINDPEYLEDIVSGGWCGWKTREQVFKDSVFYNLCMPQLASDSV